MRDPTDPPIQLTAEQHDRIPSFAQEWLDRVERTTPLTDSEWRAWSAGMRACYRFAGHRWPDVVVRVGSPMIAAQAASIALQVLRRLRRRTKPPSPAAIDTVVTSVMVSTVDARFHPAVHAAACAAVRGALEAFPAGHRPRTPVWVTLPTVPIPPAAYAVLDRQAYHTVWSDLALPLHFAVDFDFDVAVHLAVAASLSRWYPDLMLRSQAGAALAAFLRDELNLLSGDDELWQHSRAHQDAHLTRWWWPTRDFVMVCDLPVELHTERAVGRRRLHNGSGPAIRWTDGWAAYFWHGTHVPADLIESGWSAERILAEPNAEIRRCAIERLGWQEFAVATGLTPLDQAPDPANPGQLLRLYELPGRMARTRVLVCTNATRERDGSRHSFGLTVPPDCRTALAAAAWTFDVPETDYATLARAT